MFCGFGARLNPSRARAFAVLVRGHRAMSAKLEKIYYENRSTPEIAHAGEPGQPKEGYGPETSRQETTTP